jgi:hypothetical protein
VSKCPATARIENAGRDGAPVATACASYAADYGCGPQRFRIRRGTRQLSGIAVTQSSHRKSGPFETFSNHSARRCGAHTPRERGSGLKGKSGRPQASRTAVALIGFIRFACTPDRTSREIRMPSLPLATTTGRVNRPATTTGASGSLSLTEAQWAPTSHSASSRSESATTSTQAIPAAASETARAARAASDRLLGPHGVHG